MAYGYEYGVRYKHFNDWKAIVKLLKYPDIRTAIIKEYEKHGGFIKTARVFGVSKSTIGNKLREFKYHRIKTRGGPNNPTGRKFVNMRGGACAKFD